MIKFINLCVSVSIIGILHFCALLNLLCLLLQLALSLFCLRLFFHLFLQFCHHLINLSLQIRTLSQTVYVFIYLFLIVCYLLVFFLNRLELLGVHHCLLNHLLALTHYVYRGHVYLIYLQLI
jgi:hypothetical protein